MKSWDGWGEKGPERKDCGEKEENHFRKFVYTINISFNLIVIDKETPALSTSE